LEDDFDGLYRDHATNRGRMTLRAWIDLATAWRIAQALREHRGNRSAAARSLGIGRRTLYSKMERLGIRPTWTAAAPRGGEASPLGTTGADRAAATNEF
jgi:DNA-binding NtrC family response regulator